MSDHLDTRGFGLFAANFRCFRRIKPRTMCGLIAAASLCGFAIAGDISPCQPDPNTADRDQGPKGLPDHGGENSCNDLGEGKEPQRNNSGNPRRRNCPDSDCSKEGGGVDYYKATVTPPPTTSTIVTSTSSFLQAGMGPVPGGWDECITWGAQQDCGSEPPVLFAVPTNTYDTMRPTMHRYSGAGFGSDYVTINTPEGNYKTFRRYPFDNDDRSAYSETEEGDPEPVLFVGMNGESGVVVLTPPSGPPPAAFEYPLARYYPADGTTWTFFGFFAEGLDASGPNDLRFRALKAQGEFWKMERPVGASGNSVLYTGDIDDPVEALQNGFTYEASLLIGKNALRPYVMNSTDGFEYLYVYDTTIPFHLRAVEIRKGEEEDPLQTISYNYYDDVLPARTEFPLSNQYAVTELAGRGGRGSLRLLTITTRQSADEETAGPPLVEHTYFRYYTEEDAFIPGTSPAEYDSIYQRWREDPETFQDPMGFCRQLKAKVGPEGVRRLMRELGKTTETIDSVLDRDLVKFADTWVQPMFPVDESYEYLDEENEPALIEFTTIYTRYLSTAGCGCGGSGSVESWKMVANEYTLLLDPPFERMFFKYGMLWNPEPGQPVPNRVSRSFERRPDGTFAIKFFDTVGQSIGEAIAEKHPRATWEADRQLISNWEVGEFQGVLSDRDSRGREIRRYSPSAFSGIAGLLTTNTVTLSTNSGLVTHLDYTFAYPGDTYSQDNKDERTDNLERDLLSGAVTRVSHSKGTGGPAVVDRETSYITATDGEGNVTWGGTKVLPPSGSPWGGADSVRMAFANPVSTKRYKDATSSEDTASTYTYWSTLDDSPDRLLKSVSTASTVETDENGSGSATSTTTYVYRDGVPAFRRSQDGRWTYYEYNTARQVSRRIEDVVAGYASDGGVDEALDDFDISPSFPSDGQHLVHEYTYDDIGRLIRHKLPPTASVADRAEEYRYFTAKDGRKIILSIPMVITVGEEPRYYGPVGYRVENLAGKVDVEAQLAITGDSDGLGGTLAYTTTAPEEWLDLEADKNVIKAVQSPAAVSRLRVNIYNRPGVQLEESRVYHAIPASSATDWESGGPSSWTFLTASSSDITSYEYDPMGRMARVTDPTGTITRTVFDFRGLPIERWVGTDDADATVGNGRTSPTTASGDMTKVAAFEYIPGEGASDGWLTKRTEDADGNWGDDSDQRVTEYLRDYRGRVIVEKRTDAPTIVRKYDNLGRVIAQATFARGTSGIDNASQSALDADDLTRPSTATGRLSLSETFYDGRGQVWKTVNHRINQSTGGIETESTNALTNLFRYDPAGRLIKTTGTSLTKTRYDGLGRVLRRWTLAADGTGIEVGGEMGAYASDYGDYDPGTADGQIAMGTLISGDVVLELQQSVYEQATGNLLGRLNISRSQAEPLSWTSTTLGTMGDLHTDIAVKPASIAAGNVKGRMQLTTYFYDDLSRVTRTGFWGHGGVGGFTDFDPITPTASSGTAAGIPGSIPSSSTADVLVTRNKYNAKGELEVVADADGKLTKTEYTDDGRVQKTIRNYVNGTAGGGTYDDQDQIVEYAYTDGLLTAMTAVLPTSQTTGSPAPAAGPQVTTYVYGTSKGGTLGGSASGDSAFASFVATKHLLNRTIYPEGTTSSDLADRTVHVAYNALGEAAWSRDQLGNVMVTARDKAGRITATTATVATAATDTDDGLESTDTAVGSIHLAYNARGMVSSVWQNAPGDDDIEEAVDHVKYVYDDYGMLTESRQKVDGQINPSTPDGYFVEFASARAAPVKSSTAFVGRQGIRRTGMTLRGAGASSVIAFNYGTAGNLNDLVGRVQSVDMKGDGTIAAATYTYLGAASLVGTTLDEPGFTNRLFGTGPSETDTYKLVGAGAGMDRFGRVTESRWGREGSGGATENEAYAYWTSVGYGSASEITSVADRLMPGHDVAYTNDGLHRLMAAQEGTLASGSISSQKFKQNWSLSHTGNWLEFKDYATTGTATRTETRTNTAVNEIATRTVNSTPTTFYYNKAGQLVNDGVKIYTYDAWGRLRKVFTIDSGDKDDLVEESRYNGLGHRIAYKLDTDMDGDLDGVGSTDNVWVDQVYDDSWRVVATFKRGDATDKPRERFVYHAAGMDGRGTSSYIDDVILRERSDSVGWGSSAPSTLGDRLYYLQNWRHDVSVLVKPNGQTVERIKYTSYGVPRGRSAGDFNGDGVVDDADFSLLQEQYEAVLVTYGSPHTAKAGSPAVEVEAWGEYDLNNDGVVDDGDFTVFGIAYNDYEGIAEGQLSRRSPTSPELNIDNRIGYAGYAWSAGTEKYNVRHRVYAPNLGWATRDPLVYIDGENLYSYLTESPIETTDPLGLCGEPQDSKDPCSLAFTKGLDDGDVGGIICYKGKKYSCVWRRGGLSNPSNDKAMGIINDCAKVHEDTHIDQTQDCPSSGDGVTRPGYKGGWSKPKGECAAYAAHKQCLRTNISKCKGDKECISQVFKEIDKVNEQREHYHCNESKR